MATFEELLSQVDEGLSPSAGASDYTEGMTRNVVNDLRFLKDLRSYYATSGRGFKVDIMSDGELIDQMLKDGTWREMGNSIAVGTGVLEAMNADPERRAQMIRLQKVYDIMPNFWEEGGRGWGGFKDNAAAAILDPVNLITLGAGSLVAKGVARTALATGEKTAAQAARAGLKSGVARSVLNEGVVNAGIAGASDAGMQMRDMQLGLQDEFSTGRALASTAIGGVVGGAIGGVLGVAPSAAAARIGVQEAEALARNGVPTDVINKMTDEQIAAAMGSPEAAAAVVRSIGAGPQGTEPAPAPTAGAPTSAVGAEVFGPGQMELEAGRLEQNIARLRTAYETAVADGTDDAPILNDILTRMANLRTMRDRLAAEQKTLIDLSKSEKEGDQIEIARRRKQFEEDYANYRIAVSDPEDGRVSAIIAREIARAKEAEAPKAAATAPADAPAPSVKVAVTPAAEPTAAPEVTVSADMPAGKAKRQAKAKAAAATAPEAAPVAEVVPPTSNVIPPAPVADAAQTAQTGKIEVQQPANDHPWAALPNKEVAAAFLNMVQPLRSKGMTVTEMRRAMSMIARDAGLPAGTIRSAMKSFDNRIEQMRQLAAQNKLDDFYPGNDMEMKPGIFDRMAEEITPTSAKLGSEDANSILMSLRKKMMDTDARLKAEDEGVDVSGMPAPEKLNMEELQLLKRLAESEARENPDFTQEQAAMSAIRKLKQMEDMPERSLTRSNAARLEAAAPPEGAVTGDGTRTVPISEGSDYTVTGRMLPTEEKMGVQVAKAEQAAARKHNERIAKIKDSKEEPRDIIIPFTATGRVKDVADGKPIPKGGQGWVGRDGRIYREEANARGDRASAGATYEPKPEPIGISLADLLAKYDPKGDGSGDGRALFEEIRKLTSGEIKPESAKKFYEKAGTAIQPGTPMVRNVKTGVVRVMPQKLMAEKAPVSRLIGSGNPDDFELRFAPEGIKETRDPEKLDEIWANGTDYIPETSRPAEKPVAYGEVANKEVVLTADEMAVINLPSDFASSVGTSGTTSKPLKFSQFMTYVHWIETKPWEDILSTGFEAHRKSIAAAYGVVSRIAPYGFVMPKTERKTTLTSLENIFGTKSPEDLKAAYELIKRLGGDKTAGPALVDGGALSAAQPAFDMPGRSPTIKLGNMKALPRSITLMHEVAHWAYWNILKPEDRMQFWDEVVPKYVTEAGELDLAKLKNDIPRIPGNYGDQSLKTNSLSSPQEMFAGLFEGWAANKLTRTVDGKTTGPLDSSLWQRVTTYLKGLFDRYIRGVEVDPSLEKLFSKILVDEEDLAVRAGGIVRDPKTPTGKAVLARLEQTKDIRRITQAAIDGGNEAEIATAINDVVRHLMSLTTDLPTQTGTLKAGWDKPIIRLYPMIRQRINEYLTIIGRGVVEGDDDASVLAKQAALADMGMNLTADQSAAYAELPKFWSLGAAEGGISKPDPRVAEMLAAGKIKDPRRTSLDNMLGMVISGLNKAYGGIEGGSAPRVAADVVDATPATNGKVAEEVLTKAVKQQDRVAKAVDAAATANLKEKPKGKGKAAKAKPKDAKAERKGEAAKAASLQVMSLDQLRQGYLAARGIDDEPLMRTISAAIMAKKKAEPPPSNVAVSKELAKKTMAMRSDELAQIFIEGNDGDLYNAAWAEAHRRFLKNGEKVAKADKMEEFIGREVDDNEGYHSQLGIPPNARAQIRDALSYLTHRDPETLYTLRTMAYRMMNLMGKTAKNAMDDTTFMTSRDIARLANVDESQLPRAAFVDLSAPEFKTLRTNFRKFAIGLNSAVVNPFDLMHEIGHLVARTTLTDDEVRFVKAAYEAADEAADPIKARVVELYTGRYADHPQGPERMAEEWFAEHMTQYLGERQMRGDVAAAMKSGDMSGLTVMTSIDRIIDRTREGIAYLVNGLMGRKDMKQIFRSLTMYGDMFERPRAGRVFADLEAIPASQAGEHARVFWDSAPGDMRDRIKRFLAGGAGWDAENDAPLAFFHGTIFGRIFDRATNPDVSVKMSADGHYGPGFYATMERAVAELLYSKRPTIESMLRAFKGRSVGRTNVPGELRFYELLADIQTTRDAVKSGRREYTRLMMLADETKSQAALEKIYQRMADKQREVDLAIKAEFELTESVKKYGVEYEPTVLPLYIRMVNPADFRMDTVHSLGGDNESMFAKNLLNELFKKKLISNEAAAGVLSQLEDGLTGDRLYKSLKDAIEATTKGKNAPSGAIRLNRVLEDMGYDGLQTTHFQLMGVDGATLAADGISYAAAVTPNYTLVAFNANNVKHIHASEFNENKPGLYHRDVGSMPRGTTLSVIEGLMDPMVESISPAAVGETVEASGGDKSLSGAIMSMIRRRPPTPEEVRALRKRGPAGWIASQSEQFDAMGMKWMANDYADYFPRVMEQFGRKVLPTLNKLRSLPDARGPMKDWFYKVTMGVRQDIPESHKRIFNAFLQGRDSRHFASLSREERMIYDDIANLNRQYLVDLRKEGVTVGNLSHDAHDYMSQVWSTNDIMKDPDAFEDGMRTLYWEERKALGIDGKIEEADRFARNMLLTLGDGESDGVFIPGTFTSGGGTRNPNAENIDYNRMIRLDRYPAAREKLAPFLEKDIAAIQTKYSEAAERRLAFVRKWGVNGHAFYDYLLAAQTGAEGIAKLLSTNKVFRSDFKFLDEQGIVGDAVFQDVDIMPFTGREQEARDFADRLVEIAQDSRGGGAPAMKALLMEIAPKDSSGNVPMSYVRRADAIAGALSDYKGATGIMRGERGRDTEMFAVNAMRVLMRKRQLGVNYGTARISTTVRNINNITLLGFTTLSSLGDLATPLVRSGSMKSYLKAMRNMADDPEYRRAIFSTGVAVENMLHDRLINLYGSTSDKFNQAFFNATMLTPWTNMMQQVGGAVGFETLKSMAAVAAREYNPAIGSPAGQSRKYRLAHRMLYKYGMQDFLPGGSRYGENITLSHLEADETVRLGVMKFSRDAVFSPTKNDVPLWAQTPGGAVIFQLKSFPLMMHRMARDVLKEAKDGNIMPLVYLFSVLPGMGMGALAIKDVVQMRGGEDNREAQLRDRSLNKIAESMGFKPELHGDVDKFLGWYVEGVLQAGGIGLVADMLYGLADNAENGAYGAVRAMGIVAGPTVSLGVGGYNALGGMKDALLDTTPDSNAKERAGVREVAARIPVLGGIRSVREGITDAVAGETSEAQPGEWRDEWRNSEWKDEWRG